MSESYNDFFLWKNVFFLQFFLETHLSRSWQRFWNLVDKKAKYFRNFSIITISLEKFLWTSMKQFENPAQVFLDNRTKSYRTLIKKMESCKFCMHKISPKFASETEDPVLTSPPRFFSYKSPRNSAQCPKKIRKKSFFKKKNSSKKFLLDPQIWFFTIPLKFFRQMLNIFRLMSENTGSCMFWFFFSKMFLWTCRMPLCPLRRKYREEAEKLFSLFE